MEGQRRVRRERPGHERGDTIERPPEAAADAASSLLALQRAAGNQAVARAVRGAARGRVLQRLVRVTRIDFDPTAAANQAWRHGHIEHELFWPALQSALAEDEDLDTDKRRRDFRNHLDNVVKDLKTHDHEGTDIPTLAGAIADALVSGYVHKGFGAAGTKRTLFLGHITTQLVKHIEKSATKDMDAGEAYGFDLMKKVVEENGGQMSRKKGEPTKVTRDKLPQELEASIKDWRKGWVKETRPWTAAGLKPEQVLPRELAAIVAKRQKAENRYQGNHTNNAGWLPAGVAPVNHVDAVFQTVYNGASVGLRAQLDQAYPAQALGMETGTYDNSDPLRAEFVQRVAAAKAGLTDGQVRRSVWAALAQGVSPYIEFSTTDFISRMVYDCVGDKVFASAHYKWREGYNPWFEVENWNQ